MRPYGRKVLSVQNLSMGKMVRNTSFSVYGGQNTAYSNSSAWVGRKRQRSSQEIKGGVVYVTEDRKIEGFFEFKSIAENIYMNLLSADLNKHLVISYSEMMELAEK